jgi:hypothetical protein
MGGTLVGICRPRRYTASMKPTWIEDVFFKPPPRLLYFEKLGCGVVQHCHIELTNDEAKVRFESDEELSCNFQFGNDSEAKAIEYVQLNGYSPATDWTLPPPKQ